MRKHRWKTGCAVLSAVLIAALCMGLFAYRARSVLPLTDDAAVLAGKLSFFNGTLASPSEPEEPTAAVSTRPLAQSATEAQESQRPKNTTHTGASYPVVETQVDNGNTRYENISIRNGTGIDLDIGSLLSADLPFSVGDNRTVQVLVYHTHTCESYLDEDTGVYYEDFYPRSTDGSQGVVAVGDRLVETLREHGIGAVHDTTLHDYPSYEGSYARSWETICACREKYPNIVVTIDLHRDSMTADDGTKYKPTFEYEGQKAAQIMIMTGHDTEGDFDFWDENLIFAMQLQKKCEDLYPGMTRPLNFGDFTYNMNFNSGSLLIEVGTDANTVEEAARTGEYLANALSSLLQNN